MFCKFLWLIKKLKLTACNMTTMGLSDILHSTVLECARTVLLLTYFPVLRMFEMTFLVLILLFFSRWWGSVGIEVRQEIKKIVRNSLRELNSYLYETCQENSVHSLLHNNKKNGTVGARGTDLKLIISDLLTKLNLFSRNDAALRASTMWFAP